MKEDERKNSEHVIKTSIDFNFVFYVVAAATSTEANREEQEHK